MSLRSEPKKQLHEDKAEHEEMKETEPAGRPLPRFQKDSTNSAARVRAPTTPRAWPLLPFFAAVLCMGILGMRLLPPSKFMNWADPFKSWDPHDKVQSQTLALFPLFPITGHIRSTSITILEIRQ
jgi:hypothetical protein